MASRVGLLHDRSDDAMQRRAAGCNLIVAAIIVWNTVYLARAADILRTAGAVHPTIW